MQQREFVYAPKYPLPRRERWHLLLGNAKMDKGLVSMGVTGLGRVVKHRLRFFAPPRAGDYSLDLMLKSESYVGMDQHTTIKFHVVPKATLEKWVLHPEDVELDNEPSLFDIAFGNVGDDEEGDSDFADSGDEEASPSQQKRRAAARKKAAAAAGDDTDDDDSGDEEGAVASEGEGSGSGSDGDDDFEHVDKPDAAEMAAARARVAKLERELQGASGRGEKRRLKKQLDEERKKLGKSQ